LDKRKLTEYTGIIIVSIGAALLFVPFLLGRRFPVCALPSALWLYRLGVLLFNRKKNINIQSAFGHYVGAHAAAVQEILLLLD